MTLATLALTSLAAGSAVLILGCLVDLLRPRRVPAAGRRAGGPAR